MPAPNMAKPTAPAKSTAIARRPKALEILAGTLQIDPPVLHNMLRNTVFKGANDDELAALVIVSNNYGLNPILKEVWAFPDRKRGGIVPIVSIDGWVKIVNRQSNYDGVEFEFEWANEEKTIPHSCTCILYVKDRGRPVKVTEYYSECYRDTSGHSEKKSGPWDVMPARMLRHKALIQAARYAFGLAGIYDEDEGRDVINVTAEVVPQNAPAFLGAPQPQAPEQPAQPQAPQAPVGAAHEAAKEQLPATEAAPAALNVDPDISFGELRKIIEMLCKSANVSHDQLMVWAKEQKLMKPNQNEIWEMATAKLINIANNWETIKTEVASITI